MSTFDSREESFEKRFAHDEESRFKATARRDKLVGLWAAEKLGKSGAEAEAYAIQLATDDVREGGADRLFARVRADLDAAGVAQSDHQIRRTMDEMMARAIDEIRAGK